MTIFNTAYDTTIGAGVVTKHIKDAVEKAFYQDMIFLYTLDVTKDLEYKPVFVTGNQPSESNIPFFVHPLVVKNNKGISFLCTDIRPFINANQSTSYDKVVPRNQTEFNFIKSRTILNLAWLTGAGNQIKTNLNFAGTVFAMWLSDVLGKCFALDPKDKMLLTIVSHYYYQSLFYTEASFDESVKQKFAIHTINASKAPSKMVFEVFDQMGPMHSIADYCDNVKKVLDNIRLKDLNVALLITMIGNSWFCQNAKEILAVALEHPPTWNAIVFASLVERTYKNSTIARISAAFGKNNAAKGYLESHVNLLQNYIYKDDSNYENSLDSL
jgi:hypothetical protein